MNRLVLTPKAIADLDDIGGYIEVRSPAGARRTIERLAAVSRLLRDNPNIGVRRDDVAEGLRSFPTGQYLILYRALGDGVEVVRYVHGARNLPDLF